MGKITAYTKMSKEGWRALAFEVENYEGGPAAVGDFTITGNMKKFRSTESAGGITAVTVRPASLKKDTLRLEVDPFVWFGNYEIRGKGVVINRTTVTDVKTEMYENFKAHRDHGVIYQMYSPEASGPRPLILYLHGGGESGDDNQRQMMWDGAPLLAETYPDMYVMAPQAPRGSFDPGKAAPGELKKMMNRPFAETDQNMSGEQGWHRAYLGKICDIIREMIDKGKVLPSRVYVLGASMGGGGTIRAMSVGSDLFAAGAPVCPSMTPETYTILCGLTHAKIWISTAYVDHTIYRHKYVVDGIMKLQNEGNRDAYVTLYSPEELAKYDIGTDPDLPFERLFEENHGTWNLTVHNEHGILSWLMAQTK